MLDPNTPVTGRTALFVEVEVRDNEAGIWSVWSSTDGLPSVDVDGLLQRAVDAGFDDVRAAVHCTGSVDEKR